MGFEIRGIEDKRYRVSRLRCPFCVSGKGVVEMTTRTLKCGEGNHSDLHIRYAQQLVPRDKRHSIGAQLVRFSRLLLAEVDRTRSPRYSSAVSSLLAGGLTREMWVLKKPFGGMRRGDKVVSRRKYEQMEQAGASFRRVRFPRNPQVKKYLAYMARVMAEVHHEDQFGFVPRRDCVGSAQRHVYARTAFLLDIENAFDQISQREVEEILHRVFLVNRRDAGLIAMLSCHDYHLYQGSPIAPVLFNVRALWMTERLHRLAAKTGMNLSVYADDLTLSHNQWRYMGRGLQRTVYRIIRECGLKVNESKCKVCQVSPMKIGHYDITGLTVDYDVTGIPYVRPLHRRRTWQKAEYIGYLRSKGIVLSKEMAKDGHLKDLMMVEKGLRGWAKRRGSPEEPQLMLLDE